MDKEFISCDIIESGFDAQIQTIDFCCRVSGDKIYDRFALIENYHGEKIDWESFFQKKREIRNIQRKGETFNLCEGCLYLRKEAWSDEDYIRPVNINNWIKCNAKCIYCDRHRFSKIKEYKIYPVFKDMIKKNILKPGGPITISGGEPTINSDFEPLLNLLLKNKMNNIKVLTNGIKYSRAIEKGLKMGVVNILISTDSGTRDMYKIVKRVDKHNQVWKNLKKYASKINNPELVKTKFIIIPRVNFSYKEIDEFINQNYINGIKHLELDIEIGWFYANKNNQTRLLEIYNFYKYAQTKAEEKDLSLVPKDRMVLLLKELNKD